MESLCIYGLKLPTPFFACTNSWIWLWAGRGYSVAIHRAHSWVLVSDLRTMFLMDPLTPCGFIYTVPSTGVLCSLGALEACRDSPPELVCI